MDQHPVYTLTRLAPTPSGFLHLGNIMSFAITASLAERFGAKIFLRIDDVDRERTNKIFVQDIFDTLNFLEIPWHAGPRNIAEFEREYSQMCRMDLYTSALRQLKDKGCLFACNCSRSEVQRLSIDNIYQGTCRDRGIPLDAANVAWRMRTSGANELAVKTINGDYVKAVLPDIMTDFVVRKRDGYPAYQLTSLVDDIHFGIDLVVRGEDLWPSTLAQQYLARQLGNDTFGRTAFYHHPLIMTGDGSKLSKSAGATSVDYLRKQGKMPADIYTSVALLSGFDHPVKNWRELAMLLGL